MKPQELGEEIAIELETLETTVNELLALQQDVADREPTTREKTAAAAFLAQFYSGVENILKRISFYHNVPLPEGETWHVDLFQRFCSPSYPGLPELFDKHLVDDLGFNHPMCLQITDPRVNSDVRSESQLEPRFTVFTHNNVNAENP